MLRFIRVIWILDFYVFMLVNINGVIDKKPQEYFYFPLLMLFVSALVISETELAMEWEKNREGS